MSREVLTVVFELTKDSDHKELFKAFAEGTLYNGSKVTAISREDETLRVERLEQICEENWIDPHEEFLREMDIDENN